MVIERARGEVLVPLAFEARELSEAQPWVGALIESIPSQVKGEVVARPAAGAQLEPRGDVIPVPSRIMPPRSEAESAAETCREDIPPFERGDCPPWRIEGGEALVPRQGELLVPGPIDLPQPSEATFSLGAHRESIPVNACGQTIPKQVEGGEALVAGDLKVDVG